MSMMKPAAPPKVPTMPRGEPIAVYSTYLKAQKAVDALSDAGFAVQHVTIVGHDLHMVERVTGRLTYPRVAAAGFASGAWFGLFVGLLLSLFSPNGNSFAIFAAIVIGGAFGLLFSVLSYALTGGKRDFTSQSQIVAARYVLLCSGEVSGKALNILREKQVTGDVAGPGGAAAISVPMPVAHQQAPPMGTASPHVGNTEPGVPGNDHSATSPSAPADNAAPAGPPRTYGEAIDAARRQEAVRQAAAHHTGTATVPHAESAPRGGETSGDQSDTPEAEQDAPHGANSTPPQADDTQHNAAASENKKENPFRAP
ncbi:general stress protein [Jonesia quinghaiensis]|uniref:general stress protein n=1 Tax=Jonesia quinghaiensis TaxID=262806 RepID=UPI00040EDE3F|nr:general stress protein [Jonesia quinghaiensis]